MVKNLILYGTSGFMSSYLDSMSPIAEGLSDAGVILMEDATIGTSKTSNPTPYQRLIEHKVPLYCVVEDLEARGFTPESLLEHIKPVSYGDVIDMIEQADRVVSWL
jgi:sulfur relay protein TusB/DsrH